LKESIYGVFVLFRKYFWSMIDNSLKQEPKKPIVGKMVTFRWEGTPNRALAKGSFIQLLDLKILFL
jgi:hypothetical protein